MRHYKKGRKLGTDKSHTKAMKRNLVSALFLNDRIKTIESRAKEIRGDVDKIIWWAKRGDLHSRRLAIAALGGDKYLVAEIFEKVKQGMFKERNSGYTRIIKLGSRKGDNAPMVIMELINEGKKKKAAPKPADAPKAEVKPAAKPEADKKEEKKPEAKAAPKADVKPAEKKTEDKPADKKPAEKKEAPKKDEAKEQKKEEASKKADEKPAEKKEDK